MKILITGSSGLIGSEAVQWFGSRGHRVIGIDNDLRAQFFGPNASTHWNLQRLHKLELDFHHHRLDIRDREAVLALYKKEKPDATIHCAAQPSHDLAAQMPLDDFDINAVGTLNLLEGNRLYCSDSPFIYMSTNKVYGDRPNRISMKEHETRYDFDDPDYAHGIPEELSIDASMHSLFGASKAAADLMTQEYGRYYGMPTVSFRGGCLTGPHHSGVEQHGFLSHLVKTAVRKGNYTIFGFKGKQVRDQIHSEDVITAFDAFIRNPRAGAVYNLGGGKNNAASILECMELIQQLGGYRLEPRLSEDARKGDHICYYSDIRRFKQDYPDWELTHSLKSIAQSMIEAEEARVRSEA